MRAPLGEEEDVVRGLGDAGLDPLALGGGQRWALLDEQVRLAEGRQLEEVGERRDAVPIVGADAVHLIGEVLLVLVMPRQPGDDLAGVALFPRQAVKRARQSREIDRPTRRRVAPLRFGLPRLFPALDLCGYRCQALFVRTLGQGEVEITLLRGRGTRQGEGSQ